MRIGDIRIPFTPGQLAELQHRASKRGRTVEAEMRAVVARIEDELFYKGSLAPQQEGLHVTTRDHHVHHPQGGDIDNSLPGAPVYPGNALPGGRRPGFGNRPPVDPVACDLADPSRQRPARWPSGIHRHAAGVPVRSDAQARQRTAGCVDVPTTRCRPPVVRLKLVVKWLA